MISSLTSCADTDAAQQSIAVPSALLLRLHHPALTDVWANALCSLEGSNYAVRPFEELRSTCAECLRAYEAFLERGDREPLWGFIERLCELRAPLHFPSAEITDAFMLFLDTADDVLGPQVTDRAQWDEIMRDYRHCTRASIKAFINAYWIHLEILGAI